jgi:hypothetical protein
MRIFMWGLVILNALFVIVMIGIGIFPKFTIISLLISLFFAILSEILEVK